MALAMAEEKGRGALFLSPEGTVMRVFTLPALGAFALSLFFLAPAASAASEFSMSGQIRLRPEARENADFDGAKDDKQAVIGSRARLTVDAKVSDGVSAKLTVQDVRQWGQESNVNTAMEGSTGQALDVFEGYFQVNEIGGSPVSAKAGRQTLVYGDQRLLGHLEWKDEARTHDALKLMAALGQVKLDLFISKEAESGKPSDEKNDDDLLGAYAMASLTEGLTLDLYAIQWKTANKDADGAAIKGKNIMTYGARAAANFGPVDATGEAAFQSGDWSSGVTHSASAFAVKAGFKPGILNSRIGVEYDYGSGDDNLADKDHKTFTFPFHTNHMHYGYMDYFSWGNMSDIRVSLSAGVLEGLTLAADYHIFSLADGHDNWYNVVGTGVFKAAVDGKSSTDAGKEIDITAVYKALANLTLTAGYSIFQPGEAAKERSSGSDSSTWSFLMADFKF